MELIKKDNIYLLVETKSKKLLFESIEEMNEHLIINNLYKEVLNIKEIDQHTYNEILRETVKNIKGD